MEWKGFDIDIIAFSSSSDSSSYFTCTARNFQELILPLRDPPHRSAVFTFSFSSFSLSLLFSLLSLFFLHDLESRNSSRGFLYNRVARIRNCNASRDICVMQPAGLGQPATFCCVTNRE